MSYNQFAKAGGKGRKVDTIVSDSRFRPMGEAIAKAIMHTDAGNGVMWPEIQKALAVAAKAGVSIDVAKEGIRGEARTAIRKAMEGADQKTVAELEKKLASMAVYFSTVKQATEKLAPVLAKERNEDGTFTDGKPTGLRSAADDEATVTAGELADMALPFATIRNALKDSDKVKREALAKLFTGIINRAPMEGETSVEALAGLVGYHWNGESWIFGDDVIGEETEGKREAA